MKKGNCIVPPTDIQGDGIMSQPTNLQPTTTTFVVRFWCEWSGAEPRWRGRVEHVESGRQANFLATEDLFGFFQRFGIGLAARAVGGTEDDQRVEDG
jgi:hypothetical protein